VLQDYCHGRNLTVVLRGTPFKEYSPFNSTGLTTAFRSMTNLTNYYRLKIIVEDIFSSPPAAKEVLDATLASNDYFVRRP
jgi:hypothetical protein